jgi:hypothetical protein
MVIIQVMKKEEIVPLKEKRKRTKGIGATSAKNRSVQKRGYSSKHLKTLQEHNVVNDPAISQQFMQRSALELLYGNAKLTEPFFRNLLIHTKLNSKTLAETVFEITPKTFASYLEEGKKIPKHMLEKGIKLEELYKKGIELFGSVIKFNEWMRKESFGLGLHIPLELIGTITGIEMIYDELIRIEFGATA